jgi:polyisoprenoid-binding protein YceI
VVPYICITKTQTMETTNWVLDPTHSEVHFKVLNATAQADEKFSNAKVSFTADVNSVDTGNEQRDGHLKSGDFFDNEKHPQISFESTNYNAAEGKINGNLSMKGITKPVSFEVEFNGTNNDPWGNHKAGFSLSGKINRKDWGLNWNAALETGGVMVSEEVKINAEVQFVKKA